MTNDVNNYLQVISNQDPVQAILDSVATELMFATRKFGPFKSAHEGAAIIKEEFDEFWDEVKANNRPAQRAEATQLAAMAIRYLVDIK